MIGHPRGLELPSISGVVHWSGWAGLSQCRVTSWGDVSNARSAPFISSGKGVVELEFHKGSILSSFKLQCGIFEWGAAMLVLSLSPFPSGDGVVVMTLTSKLRIVLSRHQPVNPGVNRALAEESTKCP